MYTVQSERLREGEGVNEKSVKAFGYILVQWQGN